MNRRETGKRYENMAAEYLTFAGYEIITHNYRCKCGEIDLIARDREYLVFIEVKYRKNHKMGSPLEAVDIRKQNTIRSVAAVYMYKNGINENTPVRFDVVGITGDDILLIKDAF